MNGETGIFLIALASQPIWFNKILQHCIVLPQKAFLHLLKT